MIGGEFEIDPGARSGGFVPSQDTFCYASGRSALYQILRSLHPRPRKVWLPDYLCHVIVEAVRRAGCDYGFFPVDDRLTATPESLAASGFANGDVALVINYFGLQDLREASRDIKEAFPGAVVIEDDVQAFYCFTGEENPYADYRFTSLRKGLPVPDGGLVRTKRPMPAVTAPNTFAPFKVRGGVLKGRRGEEGVRDEDYLRLFEEGAKLIDENYDSVMSEESRSLYAGTDIEAARRKRLSNASVLLRGLEAEGIRPMLDVPEGKVPLFIPVYLENRDEIRRRMFRSEVFCPVHWPLEGLPLRRGAEMARHELSLIVDQRYDQADMELIVSLLTNM